MGAPSSKPAAPVAVPPKQLSEQTIQNLLEVQSKELSLRSKEMDLRLREMDNNSAHAEKILPAQERDREAGRAHERKIGLYNTVFASLALIALAAVIVIGMFLNKDALVSDIIKIVSGLVVGAFGGYGYAKVKAQEKSDEDD